MRATSGTMPLIALEAVAIDTETTGLDPRKARVVQLAGVAIERGAISRDRAFDTLVDPAVPIPAQSRRIHGITDQMVRRAPGFTQVWRDFEAFRQGRLLVGYNIGFDVAVLGHEAVLAGIEWTRPRTLCVRMLSRAVGGDLPDESIETIAAWLGVEITARHQAPGDAAAAADIFVALLPRLHDAGIRTLAEAERASLRDTSRDEAARASGWAEPASAPDVPPAFARVDPFAYHNRVADLMSSPPVVMRGDATVGEAITSMTGRGIGAVFVAEEAVPGRPVDFYGIVTERDVLRVLAAAGAKGLERQVAPLCSRPLMTVRGRAFVYRALGRMDRENVRHLGVCDEAGRLVGMISARDLLRLRAGAAIQLDDTIQAAGSPAEMALAWAELPSVAGSLVEQDIDATVVAEIVSEELRAMTRRAAVLAEQGMRDDGQGGPPVPYALLVLGSAGRGESLLAADQDNAIVFAAGDPGGAEDVWFARLGERIAVILDTAGIPRCKGGVMARNAEWRGSLSLWRQRIGDWVRRSSPSDLLNVDIFFDLAPVHGDRELGETLFKAAYASGHAAAPFPLLLAEQLANPSSPFNMFGGFSTRDGQLDLKRFALFPVVCAARSLSIRHDVRVRSTRARLEGLIEREIGSAAAIRHLLAAHELALSLLVAQQNRDLHRGIPASNRIALAELSRAQRADLKAALHDLRIVPELVRDLM